MFDDFLKG